MNIYAIGDAPLVEAFEVIGIPGRVFSPRQDVGELVVELACSKGAELVLVQTALAARISNDQFDQLARKWACLVLEIPGVGETAPDATEFLRTVQSAMGALT